jgi:hypothetical protein
MPNTGAPKPRPWTDVVRRHATPRASRAGWSDGFIERKQSGAACFALANAIVRVRRPRLLLWTITGSVAGMACRRRSLLAQSASPVVALASPGPDRNSRSSDRWTSRANGPSASGSVAPPGLGSGFDHDVPAFPARLDAETRDNRINRRCYADDSTSQDSQRHGAGPSCG